MSGSDVEMVKVLGWAAHVTNDGKCRACGGKLRLTGDKMNPETHGHYRYGIHEAASGYDELVVCENCGWTWWVHHA